MRKKICVVTAARSEYGLLRWLMEEIKNDQELELQVVVTGSHLSREFGLTYKQIEEDNFVINERVEMLLSSDSKKAIAKSMGLCAIGMSEAFGRLSPDIVVVLGDRYELLPICSTALVMNIPIAHLSGGDVTEGATIDNLVRNAVTQMAHFHFPGTAESAERIVQMGEDPRFVFTVGEPGLDNFLRLELIRRENLAKELQLDPEKRWVLMTYHPEAKKSLEKNIRQISIILQVLAGLENTQVLASYANADFGGSRLNEIIEENAEKAPERIKVSKSLGQRLYISLLKNAFCLIGNSSSGIVESPSVKVPVINVGERQSGRPMSDNIITVDGSRQSILEAFARIEEDDFRLKLKKMENPYGDGRTSAKVKSILKRLI